MDNLMYYDQCREVPESAKKKITGGRINGMTDINPMWRIKKLTEMFGPCGIGWYYESCREWMETHGDEVAAFVKINLYIKVGGEWSRPIQGTGGSRFVEMQKNGPYVSDECYKMATTDAISVACKQLGMGADVYWEKDESKYAGKNQDGGAQGKASPPEDPELESLRGRMESECRRTGISLKTLRSVYGNIGGIGDMTKLQLKDALGKMKNTPDRAVPG